MNSPIPSLDRVLVRDFPSWTLDIPDVVRADIFAKHLAQWEARDNMPHLEHLLLHGSCDAAYALSDKARFRVNIFSQRGNYSIVCRQLNTVIPTLDSLKLPEILKRLREELMHDLRVVTLDKIGLVTPSYIKGRQVCVTRSSLRRWP